MLKRTLLVLCFVICLLQISQAASLSTAFTCQGRLIDANNAGDGLYDFKFKLYDDVNDGNQVGSDVNKPDVDVIDGYFTVELDFGSNVFDGNAVWLETGVRPGDQNDPNVYTSLSPRQEVTATPYSFYARKAEEVVGGVGIEGNGTANYIAQFIDSKTIGNSTINEFSTDGTLADNSDLAVPTEKAVKAYVDNLPPAESAGIVPVGGVVAWMKSFPNTPALPGNFVECNGQVLNDSNSPFNGQTIPNLNGTNRFLRGANSSGGMGGSLSTGGPSGTSGGQGQGSTSHASPGHHHGFTPPYYEVVWIIRVK